ncbi:MAG TPA: biotin transporter BioY [Candidatus Sulfotelmatobacter sp.]|nr:biotin transporter BioY [Candidatus Sulfotelmatobacter sp.]
MPKSAVQTLRTPQERMVEALRQVAPIIAASLFVGLCARITIPLMPLTPVPLTMQNFAVLLVGLLLGSRRGFAALVIYLVEGMSGLPVFNPIGPGGLAQLFGVTGGFLLAYPVVAFVAGYIFERGNKSFVRAAIAGVMAEMILFLGGVSWLYVFAHSIKGLYVFVPAEIIKLLVAAGIASRWYRFASREAAKE